MKLPGKRTRETLCGLVLGKDFLDMTPKAQIINKKK